MTRPAASPGRAARPGRARGSRLQVCGGFDGSHNFDLTAIRLETFDGFLFTPRYGPERLPTIWDPTDWDGKIPRDQVDTAWEELARVYKLRRIYCDPGFHDERSWETEIETWALTYGAEVFVPWPTNQIGRMYPAVKRFEADLQTGAITHDDCPTTSLHMGNARKIAKPGDRYVLGKASEHQHIDAAVTSVIAHEAACDERAEGWDRVEEPKKQVSHRMYGFA